MRKEIKTKNGKKLYLLGKNMEGKKVWLQESQWDCGWYWGIGYTQGVYSFSHFDYMFLKNKPISTYEEYFKEITLSKKDVWQLLELFKTAYTLQEYAQLLYIGGSHISNNPLKEEIQNNREWLRINEKLLPNVLTQIYELLSPKKREAKKEVK